VCLYSVRFAFMLIKPVFYKMLANRIQINSQNINLFSGHLCPEIHLGVGKTVKSFRNLSASKTNFLLVLADAGPRKPDPLSRPLDGFLVTNERKTDKF
jgi:hypothetical protein